MRKIFYNETNKVGYNGNTYRAGEGGQNAPRSKD